MRTGFHRIVATCTIALLAFATIGRAADELPCPDIIWDNAGGWNKVGSDYTMRSCVGVFGGEQCTTMKYARYQNAETGIIKEFNCSLDQWES